MTIGYASREPLCPRFFTPPGEVNVLKWSHSIIEEPNFINEWAAVENARSLAFEIGTYNGVTSGNLRLTPTSTRTTSSHRRLGFAPEAEVLIGLEDEIAMYQTEVPDVSLGTGHMPWSKGLLRGGTYQVRCLPESYNYPPTLNCSGLGQTIAGSVFPSTSSTSQTRREHDLHHHAPTTLPPWGQALLDLLDQEGQIEDEDKGPIIFVNSFFVDHERPPFPDPPIILRFDRDYGDWDATTRFIWEDLADPDAPIDVVIVRPEPPHFPFRGTVATVIVHQHRRADRAACLVPEIHIMDPTTTCRDTAHSVELRLPPIRVHQLAGVEQLCLQREQQGSGPCTLHIGHHLHPNDQDVVTYHGLGIQIRIPTTLTDNEAEQNLLLRIQLQRQRRTGDMWDPAIREDGDPEDAHPLPDVPSEPPGDAVSFMGNGPRPSASSRQRPVEVSSTSTSPETISSTEPHTDWRQTVIFTLEPHRNYLGTIQMVSLNKLPLLLSLANETSYVYKRCHIVH